MQACPSVARLGLLVMTLPGEARKGDISAGLWKIF